MEDAIIAARTDPSARRSKSLVTSSTTKSAPTSPVKRAVLPSPSTAADVSPATAAFTWPAPSDAEFLRALKRERKGSSDTTQAPLSYAKVEEDEAEGQVAARREVQGGDV